jgi:integrase/recombinase XerD
MADVNDIGNIGGKLRNELARIRSEDGYDADLTDDERDAVLNFFQHRRVNDDAAKNTLINDLGNLRRTAEYIKDPSEADGFVDADDLLSLTLDDLNGFFVYLLDERGIEPEGTGIYNYKRALRLFLRYLHENPEYDEYPFWDITLPDTGVERTRENVEELDLLTEDEITALKDAAKQHNTAARDRALIDFLADTGGRITLVLQLRVGDIQGLNTDYPEYTPNEEAVTGHKTIDEGDELPIMHSRAELRSWVNRHHIDPRDEAPLWHVDVRHYDRDNPQEGAVSGDRVRDMLKTCARRAGIDEDRVKPHMFRHVTMTRLSRSERLTPQEICHIAGWSDDRMLDVYDHTSDSERNRNIQSAMGYSDAPADADDDRRVEPQECGNCRSEVSPNAEFCPSCGSAVSQGAVASQALKTTTLSEIVERVASGDASPEEVERLDTLRDTIEALEGS